MKTTTTKQTVCLYTRRDRLTGKRRECYIENTNTNRARTFAKIDGKIWTNRGLVERECQTTKADHEKATTK